MLHAVYLWRMDIWPACPRCFADYLPARSPDTRPIRDFQHPREFVSETKVLIESSVVVNQPETLFIRNRALSCVYTQLTLHSRRSTKRRTKSRKGGEKDRSILLRSSFSFFPFFLFFLQFELKRVTRSCDKVDCRLAREKKREERGRNRLISVPTSWSEWRRVREEGGGGETSTGKNS